MSIEFVDPPETQRAGSLVTEEVQHALRARPGQWACIARGHGNASGIYLFAKRNPEWEARTATVGRDADGQAHFDLYLRYVGAPSS